MTQLEETIEITVVDILDRMKNLDPEDRFHLFLEFSDWLFLEPCSEEILIVPDEKN